MKLGGAEGTPEEIRDFFVNNGLQVSDYLERPAEALAKRWIIAPAIVFVLVVVLLVVLSSIAKPILLGLFVLGAATSVWLTVCVQLKFRNGWASAVAGIGCLLILLVAAQFIAPVDTLDAIKSLKSRD